MVGGTTLVDRKQGQTLRTQINTAMSSTPDALGIISWNEFSENSYIEPSLAYGRQYLDVITAVNRVPSPSGGDFDSSEPAAAFPQVIPWARTIALGGLASVIFTGLVIVLLRKRKD